MLHSHSSNEPPTPTPSPNSPVMTALHRSRRHLTLAPPTPTTEQRQGKWVCPAVRIPISGHYNPHFLALPACCLHRPCARTLIPKSSLKSNSLQTLDPPYDSLLPCLGLVYFSSILTPKDVGIWGDLVRAEGGDFQSSQKIVAWRGFSWMRDNPIHSLVFL
jgi:hypothetical protein